MSRRNITWTPIKQRQRRVLASLSFSTTKLIFTATSLNMQLRSQSRTGSKMSHHVTFWQLPQEVTTYIFKGLHIKELLNMRSVHPYFRDVIDNNGSLWKNVSFDDTWPCVLNLLHFEKAAEMGNIAAMVKLALAYLYREGLPENTDVNSVARSGKIAAEFFCKIEELSLAAQPFTWLFIRPPWSVSGACCKEFVFNSMKDHFQQKPNSNIGVCIAKTMLLFDGDDKTGAIELLQETAGLGSGAGSFLQWQFQHADKVPDRADELQMLRQLRSVTRTGNLDAKLSLCKYYALGKYGGISHDQATAFVKDFIHNLTPPRVYESLKDNTELTPSMRYILIDWLAEVADIKDFSSQTLHLSVSVVDRYLKLHEIPRHQLQLLGVAAMVLCSRFLGKDIMTIREATWLTDNAYTYEDVVRMMGEITATLKGNFRVPTILDCLEIVSMLASHDKKTSCLAEYICELSLLQSEMSQYSPAEIAASAALLANFLMNQQDQPWPRRIEEFTGLSVEDLRRCTFHIHEKCFLEGSMVDHRDITLQAVKQRYSDEKLHNVGDVEIMSYEELCMLLGVTDHVVQSTDVKFQNEYELNISPSKSRNKRIILNNEKENSLSMVPTCPSTHSGLIEIENDNDVSFPFWAKSQTCMETDADKHISTQSQHSQFTFVTSSHSYSIVDIESNYDHGTDSSKRVGSFSATGTQADSETRESFEKMDINNSTNCEIEIWSGKRNSKRLKSSIKCMTVENVAKRQRRR
ncbi:hypothetical protein ScPMuIL_004821 [Solemya velum]